MFCILTPYFLAKVKKLFRLFCSGSKMNNSFFSWVNTKVQYDRIKKFERNFFGFCEFDNPASRNLSFLSTRSIGILNFRIPNKEGHKLPLPSAMSPVVQQFVPNRFIILIQNNRPFLLFIEIARIPRSCFNGQRASRNDCKKMKWHVCYF